MFFLCIYREEGINFFEDFCSFVGSCSYFFYFIVLEIGLEG